MEKWKKRAVDFISALAFGGRSNPSVVPYYPQKTRIGEGEERLFRRGNPERHGISSKRIYSARTLSRLENKQCTALSRAHQRTIR